MPLNDPGYQDRDVCVGDRKGVEGDETYADVITVVGPGH